jgi:hypothetical protein
MGFAWHKLIPRKVYTEEADCPPPPTCVGAVLNGDVCIQVCPPPNPPQTTQLCFYNCNSVAVGGPNCEGYGFLDPTGTIQNGGCPREIRLSGVMPCTVTNSRSNFTTDAPTTVLNPADIGTWNGSFGFYYRTPSSPSSTPSEFSFAPVCAKLDSFTVHDRMLVFSGRNRYRYAGWGVDPVYNDTSTPTNLEPNGVTGIPAFWHNSGGTGLSQADCSISGRQWPLPDSFMDLPLWGADSSRNPPSGEVNACGTPIPCTDPNICFGCRPNQGVGHFATPTANGNGYMSFQCYNPQCIFTDQNSNTYQVPPCSVFALVRAIWDRVWRISADAYSPPDNTEAFFRSNYPDLTTAYENLILSNPSDNQVGGKSNVRYYLEAFANELLSSLGATFTIPNIFLWDKAAYEAATGAQKWRHLYIVGNGNVLQDSGCLSTNSLDPPGLAGRLFVLDEVSHSIEIGSSANARVLLMWGCNPYNTFSENAGSQATLNMYLVSCVPTNSKGSPVTNYCQACTNLNNEVDSCTYTGYKTCPISDTDPW